MAESKALNDYPGSRYNLREQTGAVKLPAAVQAGRFKRNTNSFDQNAIRIVVHIRSISRRTVIGYIPKGLARELAKVMDMGIQVKASLMQIIGGYSYKEHLGALVNITI